jgi:hypothetical protein
MKLPRFRWAVLAGGIVGLAIPAASQWLPYSHFTLTLLKLWPTSIFGLVIEGHEHEFGSYVFLAAMVFANVLLYVTAFSVVWCIAWVLRACGTPRGNGTTI